MGRQMHSRIDRSSAVVNRDVNPSDQLVASYPDLACPLGNEPISAAFAGYETETHIRIFWAPFPDRGTARHDQLRLSDDAENGLWRAALFGRHGRNIRNDRIILRVPAGSDTRAKDQWLANRFAAERLRCFKFQLFSVLEEASDAEGLSTKVKQRTGEGLAALEQELMAGRSAILEFSRSEEQDSKDE